MNLRAGQFPRCLFFSIWLLFCLIGDDERLCACAYGLVVLAVPCAAVFREATGSVGGGWGEPGGNWSGCWRIMPGRRRIR